MTTSTGDQGDARIQRLVDAGIIDPEYPRYHEVFANLSGEEEEMLLAIKKRCDDEDNIENRSSYVWNLPH